MAVVQKATPLDAERLRADFPIFERPVHGDKRLVYLDSANSSQKPRQVIDKLVDVYETSYANVHRGVYQLAVAATEQLEGARDKVAAFINAPSRHEVIFVRQATEGLNLVAYAYGRKFIKAGDAIVTTEMEHHSNLVPWQFLAQQTGATLHYLRLTDDGELDPASLERLNDVEKSSCWRSPRRRTRWARSTTSRRWPRGRTSAARSWWSTAPRRRPTGRSTSRRWAATSTRSPATRCAARDPARCGGAQRCWRRWIRS